MKYLPAVLLLAFGCLCFAMGFFNNVLTLDIPVQDTPPPEVQQQIKRREQQQRAQNQRIVAIWYGLGFSACGLGLAVGLAHLFISSRHSRSGS